DEEKVYKLQKDFQMLSRERAGLLVVYGTGPEAQHEFIPAKDLINATPDRNSTKERYQFKGEDELMKKINYLEEGKAKAVIYFTQGQGELDLNIMESSALNPGIRDLKDRLEKGNYDVKPLKFEPGTDRVPEDAAVVVIARPAARFGDAAVKALRSYMNPPGEDAKKGKLLVLLDVVT